MVGSGTGWWTRVVFVPRNECSLFVVCVLMLACVDPPVACPGRACPWGLSRWGSSSTVSAGRLHPLRGFHVRSIDHMVSCGVFRTPKGARNPYLGAGFPLRCFQRLSLPNVANRPCRWRDNRHTRGSSTQVLSYYGQASSGFQRAQRIETKLSHDVLNPARVPL